MHGRDLASFRASIALRVCWHECRGFQGLGFQRRRKRLYLTACPSEPLIYCFILVLLQALGPVAHLSSLVYRDKDVTRAPGKRDPVLWFPEGEVQHQHTHPSPCPQLSGISNSAHARLRQSYRPIQKPTPGSSEGIAM